MTARYQVRIDSSKGFTRSERHYIVVDSTTNLPTEDDFTNRKLAARWAAHLNHTSKETSPMATRFAIDDRVTYAYAEGIGTVVGLGTKFLTVKEADGSLHRWQASLTSKVVSH